MINLAHTVKKSLYNRFFVRSRNNTIFLSQEKAFFSSIVYFINIEQSKISRWRHTNSLANTFTLEVKTLRSPIHSNNITKKIFPE